MSDLGNPPEAEKGKSRELTFSEAANAYSERCSNSWTANARTECPLSGRAKNTWPSRLKKSLAFKDYGTHVVVVTKDGQKRIGYGEE